MPSHKVTWKEEAQKKWVPFDELRQWSTTIKSTGKTIATINGAFDLLTPGHLYILHQASLKADILICALNEDVTIQANKGKKRPIQTLLDRAQIIAALQFVDYVTSFKEETPIELLKVIEPYIHINGVEYTSNCIEAKTLESIGSKLHLVPRIKEYASSFLIEKIDLCD